MPIVPKAGWYTHWHPPVVIDLFVTVLFLTVFHVVLVIGAIVFRIQKVFNKRLYTLYTGVHYFA